MPTSRKTKEEAKREAQKRYALIKQGKAKPKGSEKGYLNLKPLTELDEERAHEIRSMGAKRHNEIVRIERSARESMKELLSIVAKESAKGRIDEEILAKAKQINPNLTLYDIVNLKQIEKALDGSTKSAEYCRDTNGDKPNDRVDITAQSLTDDDRALLQAVQDRLNSMDNV